MKNKIADKLGYISKEEHEKEVSHLNYLRNRELVSATEIIALEKTVNVGKIVDAIQGTRLVKMVLQTPRYDIASEDFKPPEFVNTETIHPPKPEYFVLSTKIDIAGMRHINQELARTPAELEYFMDKFMYELREKITTAMSMTGMY